MARYSQRDQVLLTEAYTLQLLKESIPSMTLSQVRNNLDLMCEAELQYVITVNERILNEFSWAGAKNVLGKAGQGIKQGVQKVAGNTLNALGSAAKAGGAAVGQVASNVKDVYNAGELQSSANKSITQANQLIDNLVKLVSSYNPNVNREQIMSTTLEDVINQLNASAEEAQANAPSLTQGVGNKAKAAYDVNRANAPRTAQPPPLPNQRMSALASGGQVPNQRGV